MYSTNVENELRKVENLTFDILTSDTMQNEMPSINQITSSYEKKQSIDSMINYLLNQAFTQQYIASITLIDNNGISYSVGNSTIDYSNDILSTIEKKVKDNAGALVWLEPQGDDRFLVAAREIRSMYGLQDLCTLIVRIDPNTLVNWVSNMSHLMK